MRLDLIRKYREGLRAMIRADQNNDRNGYREAVAATRQIESRLTKAEKDYHLKGEHA